MDKEEIERYKIRDYYMIPVEVIDNIFYLFGQQVKKQKEVIDKAIKYFEENYYDCLDFNSSKRYKKLYHPEKLLDILKEVSE